MDPREDDKRDCLARYLLGLDPADARAIWRTWANPTHRHAKPASFLADLRRRIDTQRDEDPAA